MGAASAFAKSAAKVTGKLIGEGFATGIGGAIADAGVGFLLDAFGLGGPDGPTLENQEKQIELAQQQVDEARESNEIGEQQLRQMEQDLSIQKEQLQTQRAQLVQLKKVNIQLSDTNQELRSIDSELKKQTQLLKEILGEAIFQTWQFASEDPQKAINVIQTEYKNYTIYTSPVLNSSGEVNGFPHVQESTINGFVNRILETGDSVDRGLTTLQNAIKGNDPSSGLLILYANIIKEQIVFSDKIDSDGEYSKLLNNVMGQLISYFSSLLTSQLLAINLIVEAHNSRDETEIAKAKWEDYLDDIKQQENAFFNAAWVIISRWVASWNAFSVSFYAAGFFVAYPAIGFRNPSLDIGLKVMSKKDIFDFATFMETTPERLNDPVGEYIFSAEQPWWVDAEALMASFLLAKPGTARVVTHIPFYAGSGINNFAENTVVLDTSKLFEGDIPAMTEIIHEGGNNKLEIKKNPENFYIVRDNEIPGRYQMALIRQTIEVSGLDEGKAITVDYDRSLNSRFPSRPTVYSASSGTIPFLSSTAISWEDNSGITHYSKQSIELDDEDLPIALFHLTPYSVVE